MFLKMQPTSNKAQYYFLQFVPINGKFQLPCNFNKLIVMVNFVRSLCKTVSAAMLMGHCISMVTQFCNYMYIYVYVKKETKLFSVTLLNCACSRPQPLPLLVLSCEVLYSCLW